MKYKLPERFELSKQEFPELSLYVKDKYTNEFERCDSLKQVVSKIELYLSALDEIKKLPFPDGYKIKTRGMTHEFILTNNDGAFIQSGFTIDYLYKIATKTTELDLQIQALNNGEEIEL